MAIYSPSSTPKSMSTRAVVPAGDGSVSDGVKAVYRSRRLNAAQGADEQSERSKENYGHEEDHTGKQPEQKLYCRQEARKALPAGTAQS